MKLSHFHQPKIFQNLVFLRYLCRIILNIIEYLYVETSFKNHFNKEPWILSVLGDLAKLKEEN